ncbi:hypothetical protein QWY31_09215 [Cytophagales bacterium LB-30]|uniref:Lipoprotein n=1 Tax=Shiella aurantiaca TaxID=3058365 RepID=A0ABT8F6T5_9BACT|nr:hypothetical protein [Shiella aurantiaca]MDN4165681.1 hypothetical protein [Shiella aurantiaca]
MKRPQSFYFLLSLVLLVIACKDPHEKEITEMEQYLRQNLGITYYQSEEFYLSDTIYRQPYLDSLYRLKQQYLDTFSQLEVLQKPISLAELGELRNQELKFRGLPNYYDVLFSKPCETAWCQEFKAQLTETDSLITQFAQLGEQNITLWANVAWYKHRKHYFYVQRDSAAYWLELKNDLQTAKKIDQLIRKLEKNNSAEVLYYEAYHRYQMHDSTEAEYTAEIRVQYDTLFRIMKISPWNP